MRPIITSEKHMIQTPVTSVASGVVTNYNVVTVDNALGAATAVRVGAKVKAIYLELIIDAITASKTFTIIFCKLPNGVGGPTVTEMNNLTTWDNKSNIFETHQGLGPTGGNVMAVFRQWYAIPKGKQRMALGDQIKVFLTGTGTTINFCAVSIFKEYY